MRPSILAVLVTLASGVAAAQSANGEVEEVFVYLTVRTNRTPAESDPACNDAGFVVRNRNDSDLRAVSFDTNGRIARQLGDVVGSAVSCFSARSDSGITQFFARLSVNGVAAIGRGECMQRYTDFPEPRVGVQECWLKLEGLPSGYVGGFATTNAVATRVADATAATACAGGACGRGLESDPPGYVLPSLTTLRLWKRR